MIGGCVRVDLTHDPDIFENSDRRSLSVLEQCPDGVRVIVDIGERAHTTYDAVHYLHEHGSRLQIEITGTQPLAVARLVHASRLGDWSVVG